MDDTTLHRDRSPTTSSWGAPLDELRRAAAELRGLATRHGATLDDVETVDDVDLAAAVVAAELLCRVTGVAQLERLASPGVGATASLVAVLARAAGHGRPAEPAEVAPATVTLDVAAHVDAVLELAEQLAPGRGTAVAHAAATDVAAAITPAARGAAFCLATSR